AIALLYLVTGNLYFTFMSEAFPEAMVLYPNNLLVALGLLVVGLGVKAALFPLHVWLPDAHSSAPSPSSAATRDKSKGKLKGSSPKRRQLTARIAMGINIL
ncbi:hypothetical protein HKBW3S33_02334, partial [Candidatus Hakubella thermalkaliphila]